MTNTMNYTMNYTLNNTLNTFAGVPVKLSREIMRRSSIAQREGKVFFKVELRRKANGEVMAKRAVCLPVLSDMVADALASLLEVWQRETQRGEDARDLSLVVTLTSGEDAELKDVFTMNA